MVTGVVLTQHTTEAGALLGLQHFGNLCKSPLPPDRAERPPLAVKAFPSYLKLPGLYLGMELAPFIRRHFQGFPE